MADNYRFYEVNGKRYKISEAESAEFEKDFPSAKVNMSANGKKYLVGIGERDEFVKDFGGNASYAYFDEGPKANIETQESKTEKTDDDKVHWWESLVKPVGSAVVGTAQGFVDAFQALSPKLQEMAISRIQPYGVESVQTADMLPSYDEQRQDDNNPLTRASKRLSGIAERLSEEGDPEPDKGFIDLIFEGKIGKALQKGLATTGESSVTTLAARNPILAAVNMISLAGREFSRLSDEDSSIPVEKRAAMAIGGAAWEQTVEKMADPVFKYLGGGKVASEITEEMAKEALEKAAKESTENIAKRIFKKIKNIGKNVAKDAGGEGLEEIITSAGTDVLGQTLDWIDGNSDYGFTAQWEELKEQDPDADMWDFALAKAKEYGDAFIGGALSGGYMAGGTQAIAETAKASNEYRARKKVQESHDLGTQMGYANMYDSDDLVREAGARVAECFVNEAGEQTISNEFIESLSSDEAFALSRNEEFSGRQRAELDALANAKAVQEGLNAKLDERLESRIATAQNNVMIAAENGDITGGIANGRAVYVKGGVVKNGVVYVDAVDFDGQQMPGPVLVIDANTGEKSYVNSDEISYVYTRDAEDHIAYIERALTWKEARDREAARNTIGPIARLKAVQHLAGRKVQIDLGEGIIEVEIQDVSTKTGDVEIKGKKGDLDGQSIIKMPAHQFYNTIVRDDDGNPKFADNGQRTDEPINEPNEIEDFRDFVGNILINGVPTEVEVTSQDDSSDSIVYEYVDENGIRRRGNSTIGEFIAAVREAESYSPAIEPEPMPEPEPIEEPIEQPVEQPVAPEQAAPQSINWDEMFEQDPETYFSELQNKYGDRTEKMLNAVISATQKKLDALNKANPDTDEEIFANEEKKDKLQAKIDILQGMVARLSAVPSPTTEVPVAPDTTAESGQSTAPIDPNVPDFSSDRASDARARGYRVTSGQRVDRPGETAGTYGNDIEIAFTADSKGKRNGKVKVIDAGSLIPSHIGGVENVEHFIPEAQPKKRTDKASTVSASLIAQNMNNPQMTMVASSAYEGAPIVNRRGEVIQGNNRSAAILEMYQSHAAKASEYKQYIIDHASEYGLNADEVAAMQNPVLVRELDVDDSDAINLGQYTMQDMESGGNQSIDSGRAIAGLNNKGMMDYFVETLLAEENDESSDMNVSDLITRNGNAALKLLYAQGIINQTQYQSALGPDGRVNADTRAALRGIIEQQLFAGGIDNLGVMFEVLPDKAKKGIMQTIAKDVRGSEKERVTPYIQQSIEVFYNLNQQKDFASAKDKAEISAAIEAYKRQTSFDEPLTPAEKYSNFAFELARLFKTGTQKEIRAKFNALYDAMSGAADLFAGESEGKSLAEAVQEVYGVTLNTGNYETNGQSGTDVLDNGDGGSAEGGQGSNGDLGVRPEVGEGGQRTSDGGTDSPVVGGSTGQAAGEVAPVAPNLVANPIDEARKKERQLALNLKKVGLSPEAKQDLAFNAGKAIADMFPTREEYDAYAETATDFGAYNADFERGVEESFANRSKNESSFPVNSVPLESEPNGEDNGESGQTGNGESSSGQSDSGSVRQAADEGGQEVHQGTSETEQKQGKDKGRSNTKQVASKYPARKGNATQKLLIDTFGFESVKIPNTRKNTLNAIYDFMIEMSKMLGISPNVIGQGGMLGVGSLNARARATAEHSLHRKKFSFDFIDASINFKYDQLEGIAHEWWHALDYALGYFDSGKVLGTATEVSDRQFTGRKETLDAVHAVIQAIKDSGYPERIKSLTTSRAALSYYLDPTEMAARAFDGYLRDMFAAAGISIEGASYDYIDTDRSQQTPEEMAVITPAFDNLFKVLQEKEGKKPGTSILYHIGEMMEPQSDAKKFATEGILTALDDGNREVVIMDDEQTKQYLKAIGAHTDTQFSIDTDKPIFLSNAAVAVAGIKQDKATPEQWLKMIEKAGGLKAGEDKWMGLSDWLKAQDAKTLTKQEVLDFINENTVRIEEVNYGEIDYFAEDKKLIDAINGEFLALRKEAQEAGEFIHDAGEIAYQKMLDKYGDDFYFAFGVDLGELYVSNRGAASEITGVDLGDEREINETRLGYTTDGLDNKKEIALIIPTIEPWNQNDEIHFGDAGDGRAVAWVRFGDAKKLESTTEAIVIEEFEDPYKNVYGYDVYKPKGKKSSKDFIINKRLRDGRTGFVVYIKEKAIPQLHSTLEEARVAMNQYYSENPQKRFINRRVLVIDEIQSKRHQEGREKGYRVANIDKWLKDNNVEVIETGEFFEFIKDGQTDRRFSKGLMRYDIEKAKRLYVNGFAKTDVPDAPFDKNWHELAMKRMLRYAAENGYDAIAWTKGEQQAERYNIGNVVTSVDYRLNEDGSYHVDTMGRSGYQIDEIPTTFGSETELAEIFGKEIAKKIAGNLENDKKAIAEADKEIGELREWFRENVKTDESDLDSIFESAINNPEQSERWTELEVKKEEARRGHSLSETDFRIGGEGMKGFYDKMLPAFMNKYGKKWGIKVDDIKLFGLDNQESITMHSVPVNDTMRESVMEGQPMFYKTPNGIVYGWTDGKKIYLTKAGINPNTPIHEYTHLWAKAMMLRNPKGWSSIKQLLKGTPVWNEVMNDTNYSNIHGNEDLVASEALSRISGSENAAKMEQMAQQMIDEAKGTGRKLEARGLIQNMRDALNKFWEFVWKDLFKMTNFRSVEHVTDRVLFDLLNGTDLGELSEGQVETQIVTDPKVIAELEASPKRTGYRNVVQNEDGTFSSPMAYWLQSKKGGAKTRVETAKFELGKWEEAEEHPELVDEKGHVVLVKPNKNTVEVAYDPYIHNRLDPVNFQFKDAWKRDELVYVETEVPETDLESGYHADEALLSVGVHSWSNGALMLSKYDKPVRIMPWEDVADAWVARLNGEGVEFDVVPPALRSLLVERGVEILPPHKGMGKDCNDAYKEWKNSEPKNNLVSLPKVSEAIESGVWDAGALNELNNIIEDVEEGKAILKRYTSSELTGLLEGGRLLVGASIISRGSEENVSASRGRTASLEGKAAETIPAIESWAKEIGVWRDYSERSEEEIAHSYWTSGGEAQVFYLGNGKVEKIIGLDYFVDPQLAIDRIAIHNSLFEETQLRVTGFGTNKDGKFAIIVEQPTIIGKHTDNAEIDSYIKSIGFKKIDDANRTFANEELYLSDLHEENVLNQEHKRYYVIDGDFRLNTPEAGIGGTRQIDDGIIRDNNDMRYRQSDAQNAAVDYLAGPQRNEVIQRAVNEEAAKLGVNVTYATREEMPKGHNGDKGYYNTKTGEIVICTENAASIADAIQTILHEAVAHKGLRQLMGDKFNEFINRVYNSLDAKTKAKVDSLAEKSYNGNKAVAMEEYMASLAETEDFAKNSVWDKIKSAFEKVINAILGRNDIKIGDNELRYILRASYNNMVNPRNMDTIRGWAQDQMMREEYKINQSEPDILSRTGIDPTEVATQTASLVYDQVVSDGWQEFQRQLQDEMQPVRIAIDAIQQETGNIPVEDYENYPLIQNQSSSRSRVEIDIFQRRYYSPIIKQVNKIIDTILKSRGYDKKDRVKRSEVYKEVINYLIAKHGLERNAYYQATKTKMVDGIEVPDIRDYSGLTALFGMDPKEYEAAEAEAQKLVDNFEGDYFAEAEVLWERINKATDKTLRHSYESGLISRQQYNDIKSMFEFYIPLRGFDESTAEDVYSYARFEGNRFNPAVQKAGGRTSLADDPIAIIMNMAESEIAQGNKNRAKQALYNFILNRPVTDSAGNQKQSSLMQIENVWYVQNVDAEGNVTYVMAAPNREIGETYEEFENRMNALAQEEGEEKGTTKAYKSKRGKVNVGMRFQKPTNANAHYIYLKINGVEKAIYVNGNPKAADAVNGANKKPISELSQKMRDFNRLVSSTFTNYSLEFTARNYFRDMIYSHINIGVKESDPAYRKKFRQNWRHNNLRSMITMLTAYRNGDLDGRPLTPEEAAFVEFMDNGGQTGYTLINSVENHKKDLERAIENMRNGLEKGGVKNSMAFKYTLGAIELLNEASELVTRFAAFKTSRDMGRNVVESINDAKEVTVNFNTRGAQDGKGWMGAIAHYLGWSKFFFNASVQGVQNIKAMAKANKLKFCSTVGGVMASGFLVPIITSVIAEMLGGDEEEYWNIPEYDRQNNLCIVVGGGKYVKIPLPIGFREIYALGDMIAVMSFDKKFQRDTWQIGTDMANKIASVVLPINPLESSVNGLSIWHTFAYTLAPSSAQFIIQNLSNVDWKGAPLQKEYTYNENDPQWMKAFASNPDWMVGVTKWINELTSADDMKGVDLSPEKFDNFLSNMFGGIYTVIKKTGRTMSMIWNEENRNLSNIPLAGVIIGSNIDMDDRFVQDAYYDMKDYYDDRIGWIKRRADKFGYELENILIDMDGGYQPKIAEIYDNKNFEWMQAWYKGNKILEAKKKAIKDYEKELALYEEPTLEQIEHKTRLTDEFLNYRREFVDEMLEMN